VVDLSSAEAFARIRLLRSPHIGPATYQALLARHGSAEAALAELPAIAARGGTRRYRAAPAADIRAEVDAVRRAGARYLFHDTADYPPLLFRTESRPPILIARGDAGLARADPVAIVGARNASGAALRLARDLAGELAARGHAVVSGLARGIDTAAHLGALARGATIGVIATGIDIAYPPENAALHQQIAAAGLLLTELPPGTEPNARAFPARNRIIAGLALGTVVVEAAPGSGSLLTAAAAGELGREVMAVPGSPLDPRSRGANALIRDGATLVQSADDIAELLQGFGRGPRLAAALSPASATRTGPTEVVPAATPGLMDTMMAPVDAEAGIASGIATGIDTGIATGVAALLSATPVGIDELVRQSGASASAVQMALIELEMAGRLTRHAGGRVSLG